MLRVALIAPESEAQDRLLSELKLDPQLQIGVFSDLERVRRELKTWPFSVLITRVAQFETDHIAMLVKLRQIFPKQGLLLSTERVEDIVLQRLRQSNIPRCGALVESREMHDLNRLVRKLSSGEQAGLRVHGRVKRQDQVQIGDALGRSGQGHFIDFGPMGARIQATAMGLAKKSQITLCYNSSHHAGRQQRILASVAWIEKSQGFFESLIAVRPDTIGLKFLALA